MIGDLFDSPWKVLIWAVVILVLFGSKKMPDAARSLGRSMRILKAEVGSLHDEDPAAQGNPAQGAGAQASPQAGFPQVQLTAGQPQADQQAQIDSLQQQIRDLQRAATMDPPSSPVQAGVASEPGRTQQPG
jgi:sec-independent protein translocase protein TatA